MARRRVGERSARVAPYDGSHVQAAPCLVKAQENRVMAHKNTPTMNYVESALLVVCLWDEYEGQFVFSVRENSSD